MTLIENKIEMTHAIHQSESPMSGAMSIRVSHFDVVAILGRSDEVRLDFQVIGVGGETVAGIYATEICDDSHFAWRCVPVRKEKDSYCPAFLLLPPP